MRSRRELQLPVRGGNPSRRAKQQVSHHPIHRNKKEAHLFYILDIIRLGTTWSSLGHGRSKCLLLRGRTGGRGVFLSLGRAIEDVRTCESPQKTLQLTKKAQSHYRKHHQMTTLLVEFPEKLGYQRHHQNPKLPVDSDIAAPEGYLPSLPTNRIPTHHTIH